MRLGVFLLILFLFAALGLSSFFGLIFYFDPFQAGKIIIILAYLTLFFGLTGAVSLIGFLLRRISKKQKPAPQDLTASFWQGLIISLCVIVTLAIISHI